MITHVNSNESNNYNTSNSDSLIGTSNFPYRNVQNDNFFNTLISLKKKVTYSESSAGINNEITGKININ